MNLYDNNANVFDPEGRLVQVEYAKKAIDRGNLIFIIKYVEDSAKKFFIGFQKTKDPLKVFNPSLKLKKHNSNIYSFGSGLMGDLISAQGFVKKQIKEWKEVYGEEIPLKTLALKVSENFYESSLTRPRPLGCGLIIISLIENKIFYILPEGSFFEYHALAIGKNSTKINQILGKNRKNIISLKDILNMLKEQKIMEEYVLKNSNVLDSESYKILLF